MAFCLPALPEGGSGENQLRLDADGGFPPVADIIPSITSGWMTRRITAFEFSEAAFVTGSEAVVCIVRRSDLKHLMSVREIDAAFSGYASYRQLPWLGRLVGVWGRKNCQRFRRFLRERGAEVTVVREKPANVVLTSWLTRFKRAKVRTLPPR